MTDPAITFSAKFDSTKRAYRDLAVVEFDDYNEPIYPMIGDRAVLTDKRSNAVYKGEVFMVSYVKSEVYLKVDWSQSIDVNE